MRPRLQKPVDVIFLFAPAHAAHGSKVMRCDQLAAIGNQHLAGRFRFHVRSLPREKRASDQIAAAAGIRNAIVVLSKGVVHKVLSETLDRLRANDNRILADYVDNPRPPRFGVGIDIHVLSVRRSFRQFRKSSTEEVAYLRHHADPRLAGLSQHSPDAFRAVYFGHPKNRLRIAGVDEALTCLDVTGADGMEAQLGRLGGHNFHYNLRPDDAGQACKPFTKGFTAAMCHSNILVHRSTDGAEEYLGADYPYLVPDTRRHTVRAMFGYARETFGGPVWSEGLDRMAALRELVAPRRIADDLSVILHGVR